MKLWLAVTAAAATAAGGAVCAQAGGVEGIVHWTQYLSSDYSCSDAHPDESAPLRNYPIGECVPMEANITSSLYWRVYCDNTSVTVDAFYDDPSCAGPRAAPNQALRAFLDGLLCADSGITVWQAEQAGGHFSFAYPRQAIAGTGCDFAVSIGMPGKPTATDYLTIRDLTCSSPTPAPPEKLAQPKPVLETCPPRCIDTLGELCSAAKRASAGNCFVCCGQHQQQVEAVGCTVADFNDFCTGQPPPTPTPEPPPVLPCTAAQAAVVQQCAQNCTLCRQNLPTYEGQLTNDGTACQTESGEDAVAVIELAVSNCYPPPPPCTGPAASSPFPCSQLISAQQATQVNSWVNGLNSKWEMCYSSFLDPSVSPHIFHAQCDKHAQTLSVARNAAWNYTFGGFATIACESIWAFSLYIRTLSCKLHTAYILWRISQGGVSIYNGNAGAGDYIACCSDPPNRCTYSPHGQCVPVAEIPNNFLFRLLPSPVSIFPCICRTAY